MPDLDSLLRRLQALEASQKALEARVAHLEGNPPEPPAAPKRPSRADCRATEVRRLCDEANKVPVPILIRDEAFLAAWLKWCAWRTRYCLQGNAAGKKADWTPTAAERCLKHCEKLGTRRSIAAIENSLDRWQDLHEPDPSDHMINGSVQPPAPIRASMRL